MQINYIKALIALIGLVCLTVLMATHSLLPEQGMPIVTAIMFYSIGNGVAAATKKPSEPIVSHKPKKQENS